VVVYVASWSSSIARYHLVQVVWTVVGGYVLFQEVHGYYTQLLLEVSSHGNHRR
jgi:hypothetical protein